MTSPALETGPIGYAVSGRMRLQRATPNWMKQWSLMLAIQLRSRRSTVIYANDCGTSPFSGVAAALITGTYWRSATRACPPPRIRLAVPAAPQRPSTRDTGSLAGSQPSRQNLPLQPPDVILSAGSVTFRRCCERRAASRLFSSTSQIEAATARAFGAQVGNVPLALNLGPALANRSFDEPLRRRTGKSLNVNDGSTAYRAFNAPML